MIIERNEDDLMRFGSQKWSFLKPTKKKKIVKKRKEYYFVPKYIYIYISEIYVKKWSCIYTTKSIFFFGWIIQPKALVYISSTKSLEHTSSASSKHFISTDLALR